MADIVAARRDLKKTRFLADESVEVAVAVLLRRHGFNVVHALYVRVKADLTASVAHRKNHPS